MSSREKKTKSSKEDKKSQKKGEQITIVVDKSDNEPVNADEKDPNDGDAEKTGSSAEDIQDGAKPILSANEEYTIPDANKLTEVLVEKYDGSFSRNQYDGEGKCWFYDGNYYEGSFSEGMMHGNGTFKWSNGLKYEGELCHNAVTGKGRYEWPDGSYYEGDVMNGLRHGVGTYGDKDGKLSYTGEWVNGKRHGKGRLDYGPDKNSFYDGEWIDNVRHGHGTRQYPSGNVYKGMWFNNVRHGDGTMKWVDTNQMYIGQWEDGIQHGLGQHVWFVRRVIGSQYALRNTYNGEFVKGIRHGYGTFYYANGAKYEGYWYNNMKHGKGRFTFKNGRFYEGLFESDHIKEYPDFDMDGTATPDHGAIRTRTPLPTENMSVHSNTSANTIGPSFQIDLSRLIKNLNLECEEEDSRQVAHAIKRHMSALKKVYDYYSGLGYYESSDNTFILSHIQFHRMMIDCQFHHRHMTLASMDRVLEFETGNQQNPHDRILFRDFIDHLIKLAIYLYHDQFTNDGVVLYAKCVEQLIAENILKHGCKVQGHFFYDTKRAAHALEYLDDAYQIYKSACKPLKVDHKFSSLKMRDFLFLLRDLKLVNGDLNAQRIVRLLTDGNPNATDEQDGYNLEVEMTFLEFFETLVGCAQHYVTEAVAKDPSSVHLGDSMSGAIKSAGVGGHGAEAADQISLISDQTSGKSATAGDQDEDPDGKSSMAMLSPRSTTPAAPKTAASNAERVQSSTTVAASNSKVKTEGSNSAVGAKAADSITGIGGISGGIPSIGDDGNSDAAGLEGGKATELDGDLQDDAEESEFNEEIDQTRKFNFWTYQLFIFFMMKFFPAYHNYTMLKQMIKQRAEEILTHPDHSTNCICRSRGPSIVIETEEINKKPSTVETVASAAQALTPVQSIPDQE